MNRDGHEQRTHRTTSSKNVALALQHAKIPHRQSNGRPRYSTLLDPFSVVLQKTHGTPGLLRRKPTLSQQIPEWRG